MDPGEVHGHGERDAHGCDFGSCGDAPPEPTQDEQAARSRPQEEQQIERLTSRSQRQAERCACQEGQHRGPAPCGDLLGLGGFRPDEPDPHVVDEVARPQVDLGAHRGNESSEQGGSDPAQQTGGKQAQHGGVGHVVSHFVAGQGREGCSNGVEIGKDDERSQGHQNPRPRAEGVVGRIEQQRRTDGVLLASSAEHALGDVSSSTRLCARVVTGPPLHRQGNEEDGDPDLRVVKTGPDGQFPRHGRMRHQPI